MKIKPNGLLHKELCSVWIGTSDWVVFCSNGHVCFYFFVVDMERVLLLLLILIYKGNKKKSCFANLDFIK